MSRVRSADTVLQAPLLDSACDCIDRVIDRERARRTFRRDQVRVSSIASCARKVVGEAMGAFEPGDFPFVYSEGGHLLEAAAGRRICVDYPQSEEQVGVPTSATGTWTHPDVLMVDGLHRIDRPGRITFELESGRGVQIKSTKRRGILEYQGKMVPGKFGVGIPKASQVDQALLEWWFWRQAGFCLTRAGAKIVGAPATYELLYLGREDFGDSRQSIEVPWDAPLASLRCYDDETGKLLGRDRAAWLAAEFDRRVEALRWHELPERPHHEPKILDCFYEPKWYDWDGTHYEPPQVCPLYEKCWGARYEPRPKRNGWSTRRV